VIADPFDVTGENASDAASVPVVKKPAFFIVESTGTGNSVSRSASTVASNITVCIAEFGDIAVVGKPHQTGVIVACIGRRYRVFVTNQ